jgi:hypothetical protein
MSAEPGAEQEHARIKGSKEMTREQLLEKAAGELAQELALMHATLFNLIAALRKTQLSRGQPSAINEAEYELMKSQKKFFAAYADEMGGANPETN